MFRFDTDNAEIFSQQISEIQDRKQVREIKKALGNARELYNLIRASGKYDLLKQIDFQKLNKLYRETSNHLDLLNLKENIENSNDTTNLLNLALEDVVFMFTVWVMTVMSLKLSPKYFCINFSMTNLLTK